jgi:type IV pilus assembly protein PilB
MSNILEQNKELGELLLKESYISESDLAQANDIVRKSKSTLRKVLYDMGILNDDVLGQAMAEYFDVEYIDLDIRRPAVDVVKEISKSKAKKYRLVLVSKEKKKVIVATDDPNQKGLKSELKGLFGKTKVEIGYSLPSEIDRVLLYYRPSVKSQMEKVLDEGVDVAPKILDIIFDEALKVGASDVHFEPTPDKVNVRFRVDGVLNLVAEIEHNYYGNVLNRIKVLSSMRIDEHFSAQDGALHYSKDNLDVDMRISIVPTLDGEKVVIRLLTAYVENLSMDNLGLSPYNRDLLERSSKKPFGMIIVTGPTGSGKTTTLYSAIRVLNKPEVNITTIEDPVEYKVVGINQIQVNRQTNLTFSKGLRSIVRQDPDIILVGEIRDKETAEIGINAAMTGHLLLSTFHANDAATAIPRMIDMGVEPFLLASILEVLIGQRLVRKICPVCKVSDTVKIKDLKDKHGHDLSDYFDNKTVTVFKGKGCQACDHTGYDGRTAIFEFIEITSELTELILNNPSTSDIWKVARKQGAKSMFEDGLEKVKSGVTTIDEVLRVTEPPKYE